MFESALPWNRVSEAPAGGGDRGGPDARRKNNFSAIETLPGPPANKVLSGQASGKSANPDHQQRVTREGSDWRWNSLQRWSMFKKH
jgi:hypothetical protein